MNKLLKKKYREQVENVRKHLTVHQQETLSREVANQVRHVPAFKKAHRIAFYLPYHNEVDPSFLIQEALKGGKPTFLPALHPSKMNTLVFVQVQKNTTLVKNKFGILEPDIRLHPPTPIWQLDLICVPLVAFDAKGHRIGMGAGYYDRTFAFRKHAIKPKLLGLAYDFQAFKTIPSHGRDIPLDYVATPTKWIDCNN